MSRLNDIGYIEPGLQKTLGCHTGSLLLFAGLLVGACDSRDKRAAEIIARMESTYSSCKTYRDRIEVNSVYSEGKKVVESVKSTASCVFLRPAHLRFEFSEPDRRPGSTFRCVLWAQGKRMVKPFGGTDTPSYRRETWVASGYYGFSPDPKVERDEPLSSVVAGFTGITHGTAHTVTGLLMPNEISGLHFNEYKDARLIRSERFDGADCFVLESNTIKERLWIDKKSYALRKSVEVSNLGTFGSSAIPMIVSKTTVFHPEFGIKVKQEEFEFVPPIVGSLTRIR